mgnify:FL=1
MSIAFENLGSRIKDSYERHRAQKAKRRAQRRERKRKRSKEKKKRRREKSFSRIASQQKQVREMLKSPMAPELFHQLQPSVQAALWLAGNSELYDIMATTLGHKSKAIIALCPIGDGLKAWQLIELRWVECSAGSQAVCLNKILQLNFSATGTNGQRASIMSYVDRLQYLDSMYMQSNGGQGIDASLMRVKLLSLPMPQYQFPVQFIEQSDTEAEIRSTPKMTCQQIISYLQGWEIRQKRQSTLPGQRGGGYAAVKDATWYSPFGFWCILHFP